MANHVVEYETNNCPRDVVDGGSRRNRACPTEDDREVDIFDETVRPAQRDQVCQQRTECANKEEPDKTTTGCQYQHKGQRCRLTESHALVYLSLGKLARGSDNSPNDRGSAEDLCLWTLANYQLYTSKISMWGRTMKLLGWVEVHISGMFVNIHAWTASCTVPPMTAATTCAQNIWRGLIFM